MKGEIPIMGERTDFDSPTSIATTAPSTVFRRVGLEFSPEDLFGPDWLIVAQAESPSAEISETEAQKPATLNNNALQSAQEMAARVTDRLRRFTKVDFSDPMVLVEVAETLNTFAKVSRGGMGFPEARAFLVATAFIEGARILSQRMAKKD